MKYELIGKYLYKDKDAKPLYYMLRLDQKSELRHKMKRILRTEENPETTEFLASPIPYLFYTFELEECPLAFLNFLKKEDPNFYVNVNAFMKVIEDVCGVDWIAKILEKIV